MSDDDDDASTQYNQNVDASHVLDKWCAQSEKSIFVGEKAFEGQGVENNQCKQKVINESKRARGASKNASSVSITSNRSR